MQNQLFGSERFDPQRKRMSLYELHSIYKRVKLDPSFQRLGGVLNGSGWTYKQSCDYINSLVLGDVENKIILAHVKECLRHAEDMQCVQSLEYFKKILQQGYEYVSIDGNNTTSTINAFVEHLDISGPEDESKYIKSLVLEGIAGKRYFKELSSEQQMSLQSEEKIDVVIYKKILLEEMCKKFRDLNTSTALNSQEHRQARPTDLANFIRWMSKAYRKTFMNCGFSSDNMDQRRPDERLAELCVRIQSQYTSSLNKKDLDSFYEENESIPKETQKRIKKILEVLDKCTLANKQMKINGSGKLHVVFEAIKSAHDQKYKILEPAKFVEWILKLNAKFTELASEVTEKEQVEKSWVYWAERPANPSLYRKVATLIEETLKAESGELVEQGILSKERDSSSIFTDREKLRLLVKQDFKDRNGKNISPFDLYAKNVVHADHIVSVKDGGETELHNGELMFKEDNLRKGSESWAPHFPHQEQISMNLVDKQ